MCEPISIGLALVSALSTYASYQSEKDAAKQQNRMAVENAKNSIKAQQDAANLETTRMLQEESIHTDDSIRLTNQRRAAAGEAIASANAAGMDLDFLQQEFLQLEGNHRNALQMEMDWKRQQSRAHQKGYSAQAQDRINSTPLARGPSTAAALAGLGGAALEGYAHYKTTKP